MAFTYRNVVQRPLNYAELDENFQTVETLHDSALQARDVAVLNGGIYDDTAAGIAATTNGQYFTIPSPSAFGYLDLYKNNASVADYIDTYPNKAAVDAVIASGGVTSVDMAVPTGFEVSGGPITTSGTFTVTFAAGYALPTLAQQAAWVNNSGDTIDDVTLVEFTETTGTLSGTELNITGATIKSRVLTANTAFTDGLTDGQSLTLHLTGGDTWVSTWPTNTLVGSIPSGGPTSADVWVFWKIGTTLYRRYGGSY